MSKVVDPKDFGDKLFVVKVPKKFNADGEIIIRADHYEVEAGVLIFVCEGEEVDIFTASFAPGTWEAVYLGHKKFEYPLAVQRWNGVANIRVVTKVIDPPEKHVEVQKIEEKEVEKKETKLAELKKQMKELETTEEEEE